MHAEKLLTERDHVLVAFDGPVAELRATTPVAERLRTMLGEAPLPRKVARTDDPFVVLAYAATIGPATEQAVYAQFCRLEAEAVAATRLAPASARLSRTWRPQAPTSPSSAAWRPPRSALSW